MKKKTTSSNNPAPPHMTPPVTKLKKTPPFIVLDAAIKDFSIFNNNNIMSLFVDLVVHAPGYARYEKWDNEEVPLGPRQGVFAGRIFAPRLKLNRKTVWRYMSFLEKKNFLRRTLRHTYSIYTLTGKGLIDFSKYKGDADADTPGTPSETPRGTHSQESSLYSKELRKTKVKVDPKDYQLKLTRVSYRFVCDKLITDSLCNRLDLKLPVEMRTWLIAGVCEYFKGNCELASGECKSHLKVLATKLQGRTPTHKRPYVERTLNEYFYPELFHKKEEGKE